jgi:hypothetical protein
VISGAKQALKKKLKKAKVKGPTTTAGVAIGAKLSPGDWTDRFQELVDLQNGMLLHVESFTPPEFISKSPYFATMERNAVFAASCLAKLEEEMKTMLATPRRFNILESVLKDKKRRLQQCRAQHGRLKRAMETGGKVVVMSEVVHNPQCKDATTHKGQAFMSRYDAEKRQKREELREEQRKVREAVQGARDTALTEAGGTGVILPSLTGEKEQAGGEEEEESFHRRPRPGAKAAAAAKAKKEEAEKQKKLSKKKKKRKNRRASEMEWMQEQEGFSVFLDEIHRLENNMQSMDQVKSQLKTGTDAAKAQQAHADVGLTVEQAARDPVDPAEFTFFRKIDPLCNPHTPTPYTEAADETAQVWRCCSPVAYSPCVR